jgi:hypothetical protein
MAFVVVFLATGAYMRKHFPDAYQDDAGMRMMFRSAHVCILLSALLNLLVGAHLRTRTARWRRWIQGVGSVGILVAPVLFTLAFFFEPKPRTYDRPYVFYALVLALLGAILHTVASYEKEAA